MSGLLKSKNGVPSELKSVDRWIVWEWKAGVDGKKGAKTPVGLWNRKSSWLTFDEATRRAESSGDDFGVAFVLGGGFAGVDLDDCIKPDGSLEPWATKILNGLEQQGYAEVSPSGTGYKVWLRHDATANPIKTSISHGDGKAETWAPGEDVADEDGVVKVVGGRWFAVTGESKWCDFSSSDRQAEVYREFISDHNDAVREDQRRKAEARMEANATRSSEFQSEGLSEAYSGSCDNVIDISYRIKSEEEYTDENGDTVTDIRYWSCREYAEHRLAAFLDAIQPSAEGGRNTQLGEVGLRVLSLFRQVLPPLFLMDQVQAWALNAPEPLPVEEIKSRTDRVLRDHKQVGLPLIITSQTDGTSDKINHRETEESLRTFRETIKEVSSSSKIEEFYESRGSELPLSISDLATKEFAYEPIIEGVLVKDHTLVIAGAEKCCKTTIAMDMAISIASGKPFLNQDQLTPKAIQSVLFYCAESGTPTLKETVLRIIKSKGLDVADLKDMDLTIQPSLFSFDDDEFIETIERQFLKHKPDVVIFDPLYFMVNDDATLRAAFARQITKYKQVCDKFGVTMVCVDHTNKSASVGENSGKPLNLQDMTGNGRTSWFRSWLLLSHRTPFQWEEGRSNELWLNAGGTCHGVFGIGVRALDVYEWAPRDSAMRDYEIRRFESYNSYQEGRKAERISREEHNAEMEFQKDRRKLLDYFAEQLETGSLGSGGISKGKIGDIVGKKSKHKAFAKFFERISAKEADDLVETGTGRSGSSVWGLTKTAMNEALATRKNGTGLRIVGLIDDRIKAGEDAPQLPSKEEVEAEGHCYKEVVNHLRDFNRQSLYEIRSLVSDVNFTEAALYALVFWTGEQS